MNITMIDTNLNDFNALGKFLNGVPKIEFSGTAKKEKYEWVKEVLSRSSDIALLCKTDNIHNRLNWFATRQILIREYQVFSKTEYENISHISVAQIYRLRQTRVYTSHSLTFKNTQAVQRNIGERRKPEPNGKPGYIRIDTVHQGDLASEYGTAGEKGVYHINSVDEITQWEIIASVEK